MDIQTISNITLSILSFILAVISTVGIVFTLLQNYEMLESSTRPYIGIYASSAFIGDKPSYYLILKNFGNSPATITEFSADINLSKISQIPQKCIPFNGLIGSQIMPGQSLRTSINYQAALKECETIHFTIKYSGFKKKKYLENLSLKLTSNSGNLSEHATSSCGDLSVISDVLQETYIKSL